MGVRQKDSVIRSSAATYELTDGGKTLIVYRGGEKTEKNASTIVELTESVLQLKDVAGNISVLKRLK